MKTFLWNSMAIALIAICAPMFVVGYVSEYILAAFRHGSNIGNSHVFQITESRKSENENGTELV